MMTDTQWVEHTGLLLTTVSEFSGQEWKGIAERIPFAPGFNLDAIKEDDPDPFFVTLPVARVGAKSRGSLGLVYGEEVNKQIVEQILTKQPEGGRGHIPPDKVATEYNLPDVMAVGALLENGTSWAKFYVPPYAGETRDYFRIKMKSNAKAGFSIWGDAGANPSTKEVMRLDLKRIDIADPSRTGLPVEGVPIITYEMADGDDDTPSDPRSNGQQETDMTPVQTEVGLRVLPRNQLFHLFFIIQSRELHCLTDRTRLCGERLLNQLEPVLSIVTGVLRRIRFNFIAESSDPPIVSDVLSAVIVQCLLKTFELTFQLRVHVRDRISSRFSNCSRGFLIASCLC